MAQAASQSGPRLVLEVPRSLSRSPRVDAFEHFAAWLEANHSRTLGLPSAEIVIELCRGERIPRAFGDATAAFVVSELRPSMGRGPHDEFRVLVSVGDRRVETGSTDWQHRLACLPHELAHVGQFLRMVGTTPSRAGAALAHWPGRNEALEEAAETLARQLRDEYVSEQGLFGAWPA